MKMGKIVGRRGMSWCLWLWLWFGLQWIAFVADSTSNSDANIIPSEAVALYTQAVSSSLLLFPVMLLFFLLI